MDTKVIYLICAVLACAILQVRCLQCYEYRCKENEECNYRKVNKTCYEKPTTTKRPAVSTAPSLNKTETSTSSSTSNTISTTTTTPLSTTSTPLSNETASISVPGAENTTSFNSPSSSITETSTSTSTSTTTSTTTTAPLPIGSTSSLNVTDSETPLSNTTSSGSATSDTAVSDGAPADIPSYSNTTDKQPAPATPKTSSSDLSVTSSSTLTTTSKSTLSGSTSISEEFDRKATIKPRKRRQATEDCTYCTESDETSCECDTADSSTKTEIDTHNYVCVSLTYTERKTSFRVGGCAVDYEGDDKKVCSEFLTNPDYSTLEGCALCSEDFCNSAVSASVRIFLSMTCVAAVVLNMFI